MKINERVFERLDKEPFEVQTLEKRTIELFYLDDYQDVLDEFVAQGKFAVWSSVDGVNYRLAIEKGYYETLKDLYGTKVNEIWTDFWDDCQKSSSGYTKHVVLPGAALFILAIVIVNLTIAKKHANVSNGLTIAFGIVYLLAVFIFRKLTTNKINEHNANALDKIKKYLGTSRFEELLDLQRKYIDDYAQKLADEADAADALFEANQKALEEGNQSDITDETEEENKDLEEAEVVEDNKEENK